MKISNNLIKNILIIILCLYALFVIYYIVFGTLSLHGATDFYPFWYSSNYILLGMDPFESYLSGNQLEFITSRPDLSSIPSIPPLLYFLILPFALLPWEIAKIIWLVVNLTMVFVCFRLVFRLPFPDVPLSRQTQILFLMIFFNLSPTRIAIENGQTTLLVFAFMVASILLSKRSSVLAGLMLGLALSKYSLSIAVVLFFLYRREFWVLIVAAFTQFFGFYLLSIVSGNSVHVILLEYFQIFTLLVDQPGIHWAALIPGTGFDSLFSILLSVFIATFLYFCLVYRKPPAYIDIRILNFHVLTIFVLWSLLIVYHRSYDATLLLILLVFVFKVLQQENIWHLPQKIYSFIAWVGVISTGLLIIPARIVDIFVEGAYTYLTNIIPSIFITLCLFSLTIFLYRFLYYPARESP